MNTSAAELHEWMGRKENEHCEFKEAKKGYDSTKLVRYCAALANERGGKLIFGVSDKQPRQIVGTEFSVSAMEQAKVNVLNKLRLRVDFEEMPHPNGRVLILHIPSRPIGQPMALDGTYWMRSGEELVPMPPNMLQDIFAEATPDFSAELCEKATVADLNPDAVENFRTRWLRKLKDSSAPAVQDRAGRIASLSQPQLLEDAELLMQGKVTFAALILFGTHQALGKYLPLSELIFEYRANEASGPAPDRMEFREGFFTYYDALWDKINLRNDRQPFQDRLFVLDVPTFNERAVREAILNTVAHREYRHAGSVFVRQYPRRVEFVSPGGLPPGVTLSNILDRQQPRNRRIADAFAKCGLVERSGQGVNLMFESCIKESKPRPDFTGTDPYQVFLTLRGEIQDVRFLRFMEKVGAEKVAQLSTQDLLILDTIHGERRVSAELRHRLPLLVDSGIVEPAGHGRYTLSRRFYDFLGEKGTYTRKHGLDRETNKSLLIKHITENNAQGSRLKELGQVLPSLSTRQVQWLLSLLRKEGRVVPTGTGETGRWFIAAPISVDHSEK